MKTTLITILLLLSIGAFAQEESKMKAKIYAICFNHKYFLGHLEDTLGPIPIVTKSKYQISGLGNISWSTEKPKTGIGYYILKKVKYRKDDQGYYFAKLLFKYRGQKSKASLRYKLKYCGDWMIFNVRDFS